MSLSARRIFFNDIRAGRRREKDRPEAWIPKIPLAYYEFRSEQQYAEDLDLNYATTDPEESSDDDIPIAKPRSKIKKVARIVHVESKGQRQWRNPLRQSHRQRGLPQNSQRIPLRRSRRQRDLPQNSQRREKPQNHSATTYLTTLVGAQNA